jgi:hypothetical protein
MGIRPKFSVVIGITNAVGQDSRFTRQSESHFGNERLPAKFLDGSDCRDGVEGKWFSDVLYNYNNSTESAVAGVIGYILKQVYGGEIEYALYTCFPECFRADEDEGYGYKEFPRRDIPEYARDILESGHDSPYSSLKSVQFCNQYGLFYEFESCNQIAYEFQLAKKMLELAGWNFDYHELKKLLVWNWA